MQINKDPNQTSYCPVSKICSKGIWEWNLSENKIEFSEKWKRLFAKNNVSNYTFSNWLNNINPSSVAKLKKGLEYIVSGRDTSFAMEYAYQVDNEERYFSFEASVKEFDDAGKPIVVVGVEEDITTRKLLEVKLRETNLRFSNLVNNLNGGVLVENIYGDSIYANKTFCELFNLKEDPALLIGVNVTSEVFRNSPLIDNCNAYALELERIIKENKKINGTKVELKNGIILERDFIPISFDDENHGHLWFYRNITHLNSIESSLVHRFGFEELITNLSLSFIQSQISNLDNEINLALEKLALFIKADRSYLFQFSGNHQFMSNTHEWCGKSILSNKKNLQNINTSITAWWVSQLKNSNSIVISSTNALPVDVLEELKILMPDGINSSLALPMFFENELIGFIGFDSINENNDWNLDSAKLLKMASSLLVSAIKRKEGEVALIKSDEKYKNVVNSIHEVIFQTDEKGLVTFLNDAWTSITGFKLEESIGKNFLDFIYKDDKEKNHQLFQPLIKREKDYCRHEIRYTTNAGGFVWMEVFALLKFNEINEIAGTTGTLRDVTQKREKDDVIRRLSLAVESTPTALLLTDVFGKINYANNGWRNISMFSDDEVMNQSIVEFMSDESARLFSKEIKPNLLNGEQWRGELYFKRKDGYLIPSEVIFNTVPDNNGIPQYLLANFNDITERKKADEEIKKMLEKEKELSELKSKFVSFVSHEFRTPLTAILSSAEILELYSEKITKEKKESHLANIKSSIATLIELLNDVTEINKSDSGKLVVKPSPFDVIAFLRALVTELESTYPNHSTINWELASDSIEVFLDKKLLRQIAVNLISNAIKYTANQKNIYISLSETNSELKLVVRDEGIGIPEEDHANIFHPFSRARNAVSVKGTGLGLAITYRAVLALGGSIDMQSKTNEGTVFTVVLPRFLILDNNTDPNAVSRQFTKIL